MWCDVEGMESASARSSSDLEVELGALAFLQSTSAHSMHTPNQVRVLHNGLQRTRPPASLPNVASVIAYHGRPHPNYALDALPARSFRGGY